MFRQIDETKPRTMSDLASEVPGTEDGRIYRVIIDGVSSRIETNEAFAIKFALLSHVPVSRMKHLMRRLPATLWKGSGRSRAAGLLGMIEEAGGKGRIEEMAREPVPGAGSSGKKADTVCRVCGFPLRTGEAFCDFCMTPVDPAATGRAAPHRAAVRQGRSPYLFLFLVLLGAAVAAILALAR